jgi:hypothetical protein
MAPLSKASSVRRMSSDPFASVGSFLTAREAEAIAVRLEAGDHLNQALNEVGSHRRDDAKALLTSAGIDHSNTEVSVAVLRAVAGARSVRTSLDPVWTMPGHEATTGYLTSQFHSVVEGARQSVTCATYNFEKSSQMWNVLRDASAQPGVDVTIYVDSSVGDCQAVKKQVPAASVFGSAALPDGRVIVSHAKFIIVDHEILLLTSANFSYSAENRNIEFGLRIQDSALARSIESMMHSKQGTLYEEIPK